MSTTYRPECLWLLMGPVLGALSGTGVVTLTLWISALLGPSSVTRHEAGVIEELGTTFLVGAISGGIVGTAVGFVVGIPLVFLVGRHLPRAVARRRACLLGATLPSAALLVAWVALFNLDPLWAVAGAYLFLPVVDAPLLGLQTFWASGVAHLVPFIGVALLGGSLAAWAADGDEPLRPVS